MYSTLVQAFIVLKAHLEIVVDDLKDVINFFLPASKHNRLPRIEGTQLEFDK